MGVDQFAGGSSFSSLSEDADDHLTHQPSTDATDAAVFQNAAGQNLVEMDTTNGKMVVRQPGGTAGTDEVQVFNKGGCTRIESKNGQFVFQASGASNREFVMQDGAFKPESDGIHSLGDGGGVWGSLYTESPVKDTNDNELLAFASNASAVNYFQIANAASGNNPTLSAVGGDADIAIRLTPKGNGGVGINFDHSNAAFPNAIDLAVGAGIEIANSKNLQFTDGNGSRVAIIGNANNNYLGLTIKKNARLQISTNDTERARYTGAGNWLLGKTTHSADLAEVAGTVRAEGGMRSASPTILDDDFATVTPDRNQVLVYVSDGSTEQGLIRIDLATADATAIDSTANIATTTGDLTGTTGTDGSLTVSADATNGHVDVENRLGGSRDVTVLIIG